ncbi:hypothetical protein C7402_104456 [Paraburkholderia unamae]|uniref:Uncharacterized protein n=1 Tax=Paraburkholderia unamae TaxID=219649 RepID=A0ABX5KT21_9BURK|nr:hypothetical protein C7402_104456 [Paraburkholderia unamae]
MSYLISLGTALVAGRSRHFSCASHAPASSAQHGTVKTTTPASDASCSNKH